MAVRGMSLHVGVNKVDSSKYAQHKKELDGCVFDAKDMQRIALDREFGPAVLLLDDAATREAVVDQIKKAASDLKLGDFFLLTFSGHGSHVKDVHPLDELNKKDETWCLFDMQMLDDELFGLLAKFEEGVRVLVVADCCFSGNKEGQNELLHVKALNKLRSLFRPVRPDKFRALPEDLAAIIGQKQSELFEKIQKEELPEGKKVNVKARVILLSACQELQLAKDGKDNGAFTKALKGVWSNGAFDEGYRTFLDEIKKGLPKSQIPKIRPLGADDPVFFAQKP